jgi:carboxyl-terminal processing protease
MRFIRSIQPIPSATLQRITTSLLTVLLVGVSFLAGFFIRELASAEFFQFPVTREAFLILRDQGIKQLPPKNMLEYGMIRGMLQTYDDPHTTFNEPPQAELQANQLEGKFGGIGIRVEKDQAGTVLIYPLPDSPALEAGIVDGDHLLRVENLDIAVDIELDEVQAAIRGPIDQPVKLVISRPPENSALEFRIVRKEVQIPSITFNLASFDKTIGIIQFTLVAESSPTEMAAAIDSLTSQGATRFIMDMRNNGGGLVDAGADVSRLFLPEGLFLEQQFKSKDPIEFNAIEEGKYSSLPIVIVANQNTASAAEIIAGALQRYKNVSLVGNKTYGKDTVQLVYDLKDGSSLHVTAGKWWFPGDEDGIGQTGLQLDLVLSDEEANSAVALDKAADLFVSP